MDHASQAAQRRGALLVRAGLTAAQLARIDSAGLRRDELLASGLTPRAVACLTCPDEASLAADLRWLHDTGARVLTSVESRYPPLLRESPDAPAAIYVLGDVGALSEPQLAMVGSRNPTAGGIATARRFARWFAQAGLCITSGLALGIDTASHEGALDGGGITIAVLGSGLNHLYPSQNQRLARRIVTEGGAVLSEFPPNAEPRPAHFPQRNRIIAGLAAGTLVVEAARESGSLITARLAGIAGREVFAIPGSILNPLARGCHELIRQGARLVECPEEVLCELKIPLSSQLLASTQTPAGDGRVLDKEYKILLDALAFEPASVDTLIERTGLNSESIASMLLVLELDGHVAPHPGGRYSRMAGQ